MPTNFPTSVDVLTNPVSNDSLNSPSHSAQHANANDAIEAIEGYLLTGTGNAGLVKIIPTGATNGTVGANGDVTIGSAVTSVTVNGAFSATYDNYKIIVNGGVGATAFNFLLVLGGITSIYRDALSGVTTSGVASLSYANNVNAYSNWCGGGDSTDFYASIEITGPFLAKRKSIANTLMDTNNNAMFNHIGHVYTTSSATAFTLGLSAGTITGGTIRIYGYK